MINEGKAKHVHQAHALRHQSLRCMDDEEESMVIRKLSLKSNTNCSQTVDGPDKPSDGVTNIEGVQGDQVSQGGSIQEMGDDINNHGNMSNYQHNQSSPSTQIINPDLFQQH